VQEIKNLMFAKGGFRTASANIINLLFIMVLFGVPGSQIRYRVLQQFLVCSLASVKQSRFIVGRGYVYPAVSGINRARQLIQWPFPCSLRRAPA
jgi:ABC-type Co2+ transport system permease subunit